MGHKLGPLLCPDQGKRAKRRECWGLLAGSSGRPLTSAVILSSPGVWRGPDRKGRVSWKAPLGFRPFTTFHQGGPTPENEHPALGPAGPV